MKKTQYLALLRGINVGGKNIIKMTDLKMCFEKIGFTDVLTYIQSGNVIFKTVEQNKIRLLKQIEDELSARFASNLRVVLLTHNQLETIVNNAPAGFGNDPGKYKSDVIFLRDDLNPDEIIKSVKIKAGVDIADAGNFTLYFSRLISKAEQSSLKKIISLPSYRSMTIRNWNTTRKLLEMMNINMTTEERQTLANL